jgi:hypothetical protein
MTSERDTLSLTNLMTDFRLLVYLFVGFRLIMALVYQPYVFNLYNEKGESTTVERGMSTFGDLRLHYYPYAQFSDDGIWPYRDYWHEFPPVWITLFIGIYQLRGGADFTAWATAIGLVMVLFDVGNLILLRVLARRLHNERAAVALPWVYTVLAAPAIFPWWTFETMVVFFMLLSLYFLLMGRDRSSAMMTILGTLTKYTPVLVLPAVWRFYDRRRAMEYTLIVVVVVSLVLGGLVAWGGRMAVASLLAQFNKASYQSVWALIDGNRRTGSFTGPETRFDADNAFKPYGNEPLIPAWLRILPFAGIGLYLFTRKLRSDDRGMVAFFTITLVLFFLWAQGWSPQWILTLTPLILLNFPNRSGVLLCLALSGISFVEYPLLFMHMGDTGGEISGPLYGPYVLLILVRTAMLVSLAWGLYQLLTRGAAYDHAEN